MRDQHGNEWKLLRDPLAAERCVEPECNTRQRPGSNRCWECHNGQSVWDERHEQWRGERNLHWCSLLSNRQLVLL